MGTIRDAGQRKALIERLGRLRPETRPLWGEFDAPRMVCHLAAALDEGLGVRTVRGPKGPAVLRHFPLKHLAITVIPMPKGAKAPADLLPGASGDFEAERRGVVERMERAAAMPAGPGPSHFLFGKMTMDQWCALDWKHVDHHLRQFGC